MNQLSLLKAKKYTWFLMFTFIILVQLSFVAAKNSFGPAKVTVNDSLLLQNASSVVIAGSTSFLIRNLAVYDSLHLQQEGLSKEVFEMALKGLEKLLAAGITQKGNIIAIADFNQPSTNKRLYIIDLNTQELKFRTWVAHGNRSGKEMAERFSNRVSSNQSSPGFYVTGATYQGKHGYSLRLEGVERGINDNAGRRAIVIHGADYVNPNTISKLGYIGRSQGCPAIPMNLHRPVIDQLKDGACLFIYSPSGNYIKNSGLIS
ncbi:MAG: murein L,D-transpeptidase catalytic domain family protein [Chitinophagaceae bacterium]|nr:murein L,D-transpeptidase catalytic domain family protein [Chitinophagaceae bacterium]